MTVLQDTCGSQSKPVLPMFTTGSYPVDAAQRQPRADPQVPEEHLQNTDDLVALQCTARQERQQRGTVISGNPVHRDFEQKTTHHVEFSLASHQMVRFVFRLKKPNLTNNLHVSVATSLHQSFP